MTIQKYVGDKVTGLSSDTKPSNMPDGSVFYELDTRKEYLKVSGSWVETTSTTAINAYIAANAAFAQANSVSSDADEKANAAIITANAAFDKANAANVEAETAGIVAETAFLQLNGVFNIVNTSFGVTNAVYVIANNAFDKANAANVLAFNTGAGSNVYAAGVGSNANLFTSATIAGANTAVGGGANAFTTAATVAANNYAGVMANAANNFANNRFLANSTGTFQGTLTLAPTFNLSIDTSGKLGFGTTFPAIIQATDGLGTGSITFRPENTGVPAVTIFKVGTVSTSNITGALTANGGLGVIGNVHADGFWFRGSNVIQRIIDTGTGANTFASETIAGANTAVGTGANAFATSATIAANNFAGLMANATNAFTSATIAGANTAVGTGANAFATAATIAANNFAGVMTNAANNWANTKLSNGTVTLAGALTTTGQIFANAQVTISATDGGSEGGELSLRGSGSYDTKSIDSFNDNVRIFTVSTNNNILRVFNAGGGTFGLDVQTYAIVNGMNLVPTIQAAYTQANTGGGAGTAAAFDKANSANIVASNAYDKANAANVLAFNALPNTTVTFNGTLTVNNDIIVRGNATLGDANTDTITINGNSITLGNNQNIDAGTLFIDAVNNRVGINTTSFTTSPTAGLEIRKQGAGWYHNSTSHGGLYTEFTTPAGGGSIFTIRTDNGGPQLRLITSGNSIVMLPATGFVGIGATLPTSNLHVIGNTNITSSLIVATINVIPAIASAYDQANAANLLAFNTGIGANAYASGVGSNANLFASATIAGANTVVGAGANAFTSATIAGANTAVGTGANAFATTATIAANNYAGIMANAANAYADTKLANTTGATFQGNLNVTGNLVANTLVSNAGFIDLGPGSRPANVEGRIYYDNIDHALTIVNESAFKVIVGQTEYAKVYNDSGSTLLKGQAVYATGFHTETHHHFTVDLADASDVNKYDVIGLVAADIPNASHGYVIVRGWLGGINTSSLTAGTRFHLGYATPGSLVTISPEYPNYPYDIGYCIVANNTNGYLYVDRQSHTIESFRVINSARVGGDMTVEGNFTVLGSENAITVNSLEVGTQFIYLGSGDSIPNSAVYFTGSGLNDIDFQGHYTGNTNTNFYVTISDVSPDKFSWGYNSDFSNLVQANVVMQYQTAQALSNGISVYFNANTGHTVGDKWNATAFGVSTDFGIVGNHIDGPNGYTHAGLFRDATDGTFKFFRSYNPEVNGNIDIANTSFALANLQVNRITAAEVYEGGNQISVAIADAFNAANAAFGKANSANVLAYDTGIGANAFAAGVGSNANLFASATIAGANAAVGGGANAFATTATIAANNYAGVMANAANAFMSSTTTAATVAANNYAGVMANAANAFMSSTTTAATVAANNYAGVMANAANAFMQSTVGGSNAIATAAFARANASVNVINIGGTITLTSNSTAINVVSSNGVTLAANNFAGVATLNIGLSTTGVTATTYGADESIVPRITVDAYGRITSAANVTVTNAAAVLIVAQAAFAQTNIAQANVNYVNTMAQAAFSRANASVNVINIGGTITLTSNSTQINVVSSNGVSLVANNFAGIATLNIGLTTTGVTATTYGATDTIIPRITVDAYGRVTSAANITVANATLVAISSNNYAGLMANSANIYAGVMANAANAFMSSTVSGANTAVGTGANTVGSAAFAKANGAVQTGYTTVAVGGQNLVPSSNADTLTIANSNGISIVSVTGASDSFNIGLTLTGVVSSVYGSATIVPVITVDAYGRITSISNTTISASGGSSVGYFQGNNGNTGNLTAGTGDIFRVHSNTLTENVTIVSGNNAVAVGPLTVATNKTLTIQTGARVSIV